MGVQKRTRKFAQIKRTIGQKDARLKKNIEARDAAKDQKKDDNVIREM